jgi:hypothetical protein
MLASLPQAWAQGQGNPPRIGYIYPAGGRQGATFDVTVGGEFLEGVKGVYLSGVGVQATVRQYVKPIPQQQFNTLRDRLKELQDGEKDANALAEISQIKEKMATFLRKPATPALAETVHLEVVIAPDAPVGQREMRLITPNGVSNPRIFCIGQLNEFSEAASVTQGDPNNLPQLRNLNQPRISRPAHETPITIPAVINGQILPGGANRYRFSARKGAQLIVAASARELNPYLADTVPGWFQAVFIPIRSCASRFPRMASMSWRSVTPSTAAARISCIASRSAKCPSSPTSSPWAARTERKPPLSLWARICRPPIPAR